MLLWLGLASLAFASLTSLANGAPDPLHVLAAPNKLRVGTEESIFVEVQDYSGKDVIPVNIQVFTYPTKSQVLGSAQVSLTKDENYQKLAKLTIRADDFNTDPEENQYVVVKAQFPGRTLEKVVMASFQFGYIFIQTDKTIYTPNSKVNYRMFAVTPGMDPIAGGSITVEIVNPDGVTFESVPVTLDKGNPWAGGYTIPEIAILGLWKVVAKFADTPQESFTAEFEVSKYVLPTFEVKLTPEASFFYVDAETFEVGIEATYLYGEPVSGTAFVVFGVIQGAVKRSFPGSLKRIQVNRGEAKAILKREYITDIFRGESALLKLAEDKIPIYVSVTVLTAGGSDMVLAETAGIRIVTSPYTISFTKTAKYFKPGMDLGVLVQVLNPDETPAVGVPVQLTPGDGESSTDKNGIATIPVNFGKDANSGQQITAKTKKKGISESSQSSATMTVQPYRPPSGSNNYLHLGVTGTVTSGTDITLSFNFNTKPSVTNHDITYLILSRGQIVNAGNLKRVDNNVMMHRVPISKLMLPSFRVVAYYHVSPTEVVSDSLMVHVKETCMGMLKIEVEKPQASYTPREQIRLKVTGDKGAKVGLVAVDKAVYVLNNKHRLTQKMVWGIVDRYDTGCTPGAGSNAMGVFYDAGLLFQSSTAGGTPDRTDIKCPGNARRKRAAVNIRDARTSLASEYTEDFQRKCCLDGMRDTPLSYNCQRRAEYIQDQDGPGCKAAFLRCCEQLASQQAENKEDQLYLARSENTVNSGINMKITTRTHFPESWLWNEINLPDCPTSAVDCETTTHILRPRHLPDSITTWHISGVSLSPDHGICVGEPVEVIVKQQFFVDLRLPYSAIRGEQIEIRAILHNLKTEPLEVILELYDTKDVCSVASKRTKNTTWHMVGGGTTKAVPFIIIPMTEGVHEIEVKAKVPSLFRGDGIIRKLLVESPGVLSKHPMTVPLDPRGGIQNKFINNPIPDTERLVPGSKTETYISLTGGSQLSSLVENAISGKALEKFIREPKGCGEQNIHGMTFPVIATTYLDKAKKWDDVGFSRRNEALEYIKNGYKTELAFRQNSGCFAIWANDPDYPCSTWLTAYVVKVFAMTWHLTVPGDDGVLCDAVKWLILNTQQPDGIFKEIGILYTPVMAGNVLGPDTEVSMTAFTLIAMQESSQACSNLISSMPRSIDKAVTYLERRLPGLNNPYAVAITSYALANVEKLNKDILFRFAAAERNHWPVEGGSDFTREATGYALLALVKAKAFEEARPIVRWLNGQRLVGQGYGSTQVTMIVYQALAEYWANIEDEQFDMNVVIGVEGRKTSVPWNVNNRNSYTTRSSKVDGIKAINVTASGSGEATLSVVSLYYAQPVIKPGDCEAFDLKVTFALDKHNEIDGDIYRLEILILYTSKKSKEDAKMTILDIGIPTGFVPDTNDLERLSKGVDRTIQGFEAGSLPSEEKTERGSIIIYLDKVSRDKPDEIAFHLTQKFPVGILQPAAVSVYEYYNREPCMKFYHPQREKGEILRLCRRDGACECAEETCSKQKKEKITDPVGAAATRFTMACNTEIGSKTDYVYKVRVEHVENEPDVDVYRMRIVELLKQGTDDGAAVNALRSFVSLPHCRDALGLEQTKTYLIMGLSTDLYLSPKKNEYEYSIGERTWLEYWPTTDECQEPKYTPVCLALREIRFNLLHIGCPE